VVQPATLAVAELGGVPAVDLVHQSPGEVRMPGDQEAAGQPDQVGGGQRIGGSPDRHRLGDRLRGRPS
jgi:hypothetical protein